MPYRKPRYGEPQQKRPIEEQISRRLSHILRHGAINQGLNMRKDGFVKVSDLLATPNFHSVSFLTLEQVVAKDDKKRYSLLYEPGGTGSDGLWWIRANQGHTIPSVEIEMVELTDPKQVRMAVHGTNRKAWERISVEGLSRMGRQHIHFAQGIPGSGVISGMRSTSQVYIYLDVALALRTGLRLQISSNEVVCCAGDERGFISPLFFSRVEWAGNRQPIENWHRPMIDQALLLEPEDSASQ